MCFRDNYYIGDLIRMASFSTILTIRFHFDLKISPHVCAQPFIFIFVFLCLGQRTDTDIMHMPPIYLRINLDMYVSRLACMCVCVWFNMKINLVIPKMTFVCFVSQEQHFLHVNKSL